MERAVSAPLFAAGLFVGMLLCLEVGRRLGIRRLARDAEGVAAGLGKVEGSSFALFGLLLAFTFSGATTRFDVRRYLIAEESNAIGTAYLRLELLPGNVKPGLQEAFREYLDSRIGYFQKKVADPEAAKAELARSVELQGEIWTRAVAGSRLPDGHPDAGKLLLPALNEMIDITTTRYMSSVTHPPGIIFMLLFGLGLGCSLLAGYAMAGSKRRSWLHIVGFVATTVITIYVILDMEYPRHGLFRVDAYDQVLVELRASMK
jgi:hypothetical protein